MSMTLVTRDDVIARQPELVQRMVNANKMGLLFIRTHSATEIADVLLGHPKTKEHFAGLGRDELASIIEKIRPGFGTGALSKVGYETEMRLSVDVGLLKEAVPYGQAVDEQFAGGCE